ncbi:uncharacterized protein LOC111242342 [Vigna radiata var. radiata]|uniref:Uncharacterized protein LOC111242342 n=1 Tax=Vigna radiata var. radiata TaxID=3916 RepID=A0A3Q0F9T7_VIGRR|nr:uncharacterized protein LOC111242342 [Vigna radiata var. radiata]
MGEGGGGRRGTSKLKEAARKVAVAAAYACGSFSRRKALVDPVSIDTSCSLSATTSISSFVSPSRTKNSPREVMEETDSGISTNINNELHGKVIHNFGSHHSSSRARTSTNYEGIG